MRARPVLVCPSVQIIMTLGVGTGGLEGREARVPAQGASAGSPVDVWTVMPLDFGGQNDANMGPLRPGDVGETVKASR